MIGDDFFAGFNTYITHNTQRVINTVNKNYLVYFKVAPRQTISAAVVDLRRTEYPNRPPGRDTHILVAASKTKSPPPLPPLVQL